MAICDVCGNDYAKSFTVSRGGRTYTFDSFECAIHYLAPPCAHCGCRVVGHGIEDGDLTFCCAHCARNAGVTGVSDNARHSAGGATAATGEAQDRSWQQGDKGQGREGLSSGYGGSHGGGTGGSGPDTRK